MTPSSSFPDVRGRLRQHVPLGPRSWFRTGGAAEWFFLPKDCEDLQHFLKYRPHNLSITVVGACSNLIIRDGGIPGIVIRLAGGFADIVRDGDGLIVGAAALDVTVAEYAAQQGLAGMEFLIGIPGSIGGAVVMNAGAYGGDIKTVLDWVDVLTPHGTQERLSCHTLTMTYRHTALPDGAIVIRARLKGHPDDPEDIKKRLAQIRLSREETQPLRSRTGGSTFRNPEGQSAWKLIDQAGCRGLRVGGAQMSEKHCNFMLNTGNATSYDLETLGETVRQRVHMMSGISLHWEIKRLGCFLPDQPSIPSLLIPPSSSFEPNHHD